MKKGNAKIRAVADVLYKDTFVCEKSSQGKRATMEDAYAVHKSARWCVYAIMDGHAGSAMALYVKASLGGLVAKLNDATTKTSNRGIIAGTIRSFFVNLDADVFYDKSKRRVVGQSGTTCTGVAYDASTLNSNPVVYAFNIGDSRTVVLGVNNEGTPRAYFQTRDHNVDDRDEYARLTDRASNSGADLNQVVRIKYRGPDDPARLLKGTVARLKGLMMARSLGDYGIKAYPDKRGDAPSDPTFGLLSPVPDVYEVALEDIGAQEAYVVMACDGIFDVVSVEDLAALLRDANASKDRKKACADIVDAADLKGSTDNMSVAILKFKRVI